MTPEESKLHLMLDDFERKINRNFEEVKAGIQEDKRQRQEFAAQIKPLLDWFNTYSVGKRLFVNFLKFLILLTTVVGAVFGLYHAIKTGHPNITIGQ